MTAERAVIWCRSRAPAKMIVEWSLSPRFDRVTRVEGVSASMETDLVGKVVLTGLPAGSRLHYRVRFEGEQTSPWIDGALSTAPTSGEHDVVFAWSGDTNGQGWGIDPTRGGMPAYRALLERAPDFFIHCGDAIYADDPIPEIKDEVWKNLVLPEKSRIAQTLDDFRGAYRYPRHSAEVRALSAAVPLFAIWDDHEVRNNWFPGEVLDDPRYEERRVDVLAARAKRAWLEHMPILRGESDPLYRVARWGPLLDVFLLDGRSHRTPNEPAAPDGRMLGDAQVEWLANALAESRATWKVVACDMPLGLVIAELAKKQPGLAFDAYGNENGPPKERELELARLLSRLKSRGVKNVVWLAADVHYAAAHRFDPSRAAFKDMDPFFELIAGPMHATAFPQKPLDDTFGPEVVWSSAGPDTLGSPLTGATNFGLVRIDAKTKSMHVTFVDGRGRDLHALVLRPQ